MVAERTIAAITVSRSDYGIYRPVFRLIRSSAKLRLRLIVAGTHLSPRFASTVREIETDGFPIAARISTLSASDSPLAIARSMGRATQGFAEALDRLRPDLALVLGDRYEMHAAALAALPLRIPVAHIHGGELTLGAFDDALRHSITKLSHLHFVATQEYARRVLQLGEEPWRVVVSGAPGLDNLRQMSLLSPKELSSLWGLRLGPPPILVTYHPATLEPEPVSHQATELLAALERVDRPLIFTMPNADTHNQVIRRMIRRFIQKRPGAQAVENLGTQGYFTLMSFACAMIGNSSSGIIEAPSFALPVVNVGLRQGGRLRGPNVIDAPCRRRAIAAALRRALAPGLRDRLKKFPNPYGRGRASEIIVRHLKEIDLTPALILKRFVDLRRTSRG